MTREDEMAKAGDAWRAALDSLAQAQNRAVEAAQQVEVARRAWSAAWKAWLDMHSLTLDQDRAGGDA